MGKIKLTDKQKLFCSEYVSTGKKCATKAAIAAGYSKKTAGVIGSENLKKPYITDEINRLLEPALKANNINMEVWIKEMTRIFLANEDDLEGFEKLSLADKLKAGDLIGKSIGAYNADESGKAVINVKFGKK